MLFMAGGESNRNFAHHKYSIALPPRLIHLLAILFCAATAPRGFLWGILQVPRHRLPHHCAKIGKNVATITNRCHLGVISESIPPKDTPPLTPPNSPVPIGKSPFDGYLFLSIG